MPPLWSEISWSARSCCRAPVGADTNVMIVHPSNPARTPLDEAGLAGYEVTAWFGFAAPAGTPAAVIARLNTEINKIMANPAVRDKLVAQGFEIAKADTPESFARLMQDDLARWLQIVKASGAKPQ